MEFKRVIEQLFGLYKVTTCRYFTSYHDPVERVGRITGEYQHLNNDEWVEGRHPTFINEDGSIK